MKTKIGRIVTVSIFVLLFFTGLVCVAGAVPAKPGSGHETDACPSHMRTRLLPQQVAAQPGKTAKAPAKNAAQNQLPLCVIVIGFSGLPYKTDYDWNAQIFQDSTSLRTFYSDMSFGKFTFAPVLETSEANVGGNTNLYDRTNDGVIHVTLDMPHDDWTLDYATAAIEKQCYATMMQAFSDAILQAGNYIDFASYDADGSGSIETNELAIAFVAAGYEASANSSCPLGKTNYLWAHAWSLAECLEAYQLALSLPAPNGVAVSDYIAIAEQEEADVMEPIGVLAHELGHYLGLPDLYDTTYKTGNTWGRYDVGKLSVMSSGIWSVDADGNERPNSFDPWCRCQLGWVEPQTAENGTYTVGAQRFDGVEAAYSVLKIETARSGEYYLLENRQFTKWDASLAYTYNGANTAQGGVVLWHIDDAVYEQYRESNTVNDSNHRPAVMPLLPEYVGQTFTLTGTGTVYPLRPFFDRALWQRLYIGTYHTGEGLVLPLYGEGNLANSRSARTDSEKQVVFLSDSAPEMTVAIAAAPHAHVLEAHPRVEPTCEKAGSLAYYVCTVCEKLFTDAEATTETDEEAIVLPASGHDYIYHEAQSPSCTAIGWDAYQTCTRCDYTTFQKKDPLGHDYGAWTIASAPTCTEAGTERRDCSRCDSFETKPVAASGHDWGPWVTTREATTEQEGQRVCTCRNDSSHQKIETIPRLKPAQPEQSGDCPYCGETHGGAFGWLIAFFHRILWLFKRMV